MPVEPTTATTAWPSLRIADWTATRDTVHMWTQIVGKIRLAHAPLLNHWWQVTLYVTPRCLTTSSVPYRSGAFDIELDFVDHRLLIRSSDGGARSVGLKPMPVAEFHARTMAALNALGIEAPIQGRPNEVDPAIPFAEDHEHASYDAEAAHLFWRQLLQADPVMGEFRSHFLGKVSPVHFFWSSMDLACTRFSGRSAGACASRRCAQLCGLGDGRGLLPRVVQLRVLARRRRRGRLLRLRLPRARRIPGPPDRAAGGVLQLRVPAVSAAYETVRTAPDPDRTLTEFLQITPTSGSRTRELGQGGLEDDPQRIQRHEEKR
jgi:hypothetical protein